MIINKSSFTLFLILVFVCQAFSASVDDNKSISDDKIFIDLKSLTLYNSWKIKNQRVFLNDDEKIYRQLVFLDNLKKINEHNADPSNSFQMAPNQFSDMTDEEFAEKLLSYDISNPQTNKRILIDNDDHGDGPDPNPDVPVPDPVEPIDPITILPSIDWRARGIVTRPEYQTEYCNASWAFSAAGLIESFHHQTRGFRKYFSKQQLLDCVNSRLGYETNGCRGGKPQEAIHFTIRYGIKEALEYRGGYVGVAQDCVFLASSFDFHPRQQVKVTNTVRGLKAALNHSPVSVLVDASRMKSYSSGVFNNCPSRVSVNQAVLAVGYDTDGNWILKNSWSTSWGEEGFMRLKAGSTCGILTSNYRIIL